MKELIIVAIVNYIFSSYIYATASVTDVEFEGLNKIDHNWLKSFLELKYPFENNKQNRELIKNKLLTTRVISHVRFKEVQKQNKLIIVCTEKWAIIPVIRAKYGGGTPVKIFGIYNANFMNRMRILGVESQVYGDSSPGYVIYYRDPYINHAKINLKIDHWLVNREYKNADTSSTIKYHRYHIRLLSKANFAITSNNQLSLGVDLNFLDYHNQSFKSFDVLPTLEYDSIVTNNVLLDGVKLLAQLGPTFSFSDVNKTHNTAKFELFYYKLLGRNLNFALHTFIKRTTLNKINSLTYLGGLDSLRGFAEGSVVGNHTIYNNLEMRMLVLASRNIWIQTLFFGDIGNTQRSFKNFDIFKNRSMGIGVRVSTPKIYRLGIRIDYTLYTNAKNNTGNVFTLGMNQFFQPYKPL